MCGYFCQKIIISIHVFFAFMLFAGVGGGGGKKKKSPTIFRRKKISQRGGGGVFCQK